MRHFLFLTATLLTLGCIGCCGQRLHDPCFSQRGCGPTLMPPVAAESLPAAKFHPVPTRPAFQASR